MGFIAIIHQSASEINNSKCPFTTTQPAIRGPEKQKILGNLF